MGYPDYSKGYRFYCTSRGTRIVESRTIKFLETDFADGSNSQSNEPKGSSAHDI